MKGSETIKETLHKADCVLYPVNDRKDKVVIVLSGSEGCLGHTEKLAKYFINKAFDILVQDHCISVPVYDDSGDIYAVLGMFHCYAMLPYFKESKEDFEEIAEILSR